MFFAAIYRDFSTFTAQGRGRFRRRQGRDAVLGEQVPNCCVTRAFSLVCDFLLATWRPGDRTGDLATSWRPAVARSSTVGLATLFAIHWLPLATTGYLATWLPGDLATWRPTGDLLATSADDLVTRGSRPQ